MNAMELVELVDGSGGCFQVDGERLVITPRAAVGTMAEELVRHKPELLVLVRARELNLPAGVRLIRWEPAEPPIQISESETVVAVEGVVGCERFIAGTLRQLHHELFGNRWLSGNWGRQELIRRLAVCGMVVEIEKPEQQQDDGGEQCKTETTSGGHGHSTRRRSRCVSRTRASSFTA